MGENSGIQWTTHTFNPWVGCQRVSPGCTNCYAETYDRRVGGAVDPTDGKKKLRWGPQAPRVRTAPSNWKNPLKWDRAAAAAGERHRVFCSSLADVFEEREELVHWRADLFQLIASTPHLDWLLLTKRPQNIRRMLTETAKLIESPALAAWHLHDVPMPNIWFGTTVEDQQRANERVPALLGVPARVRFLSCEPLLERVDLSKVPAVSETVDSPLLKPDWIIIGGESGSKARPFDIEWARSLVRQARKAGAAPFVKQMGVRPFESGIAWQSVHGRDDEYLQPAKRDLKLVDSHGGDPAEWPEDLRVREFPKF